MSEDLTLAILIEIRDEIRSTNQRVETTNSRLDRTNVRLDQTNVRLDNLTTELRTGLADVRAEIRTELRESELRIATRIVEQTAATRDLYTMLTTQLELRDRVTNCETEIDEIKRTLKKPNGS